MVSESHDHTREISAEAAPWEESHFPDGSDLEIDNEAAEASSDATLPHELMLGEYILLRPIGAGGVGRVFKARHRQMDRLVALKLLSEKALDRPDAVRRFRREIKAAARLFHPNIVTAFDAGHHGGAQYLVMEYVDGVSLREMVKRHGPLSVEKACDYIAQAAVGLAFAHSRGVVHRDIKPSNLVLDNASDVIKLLDLGTAFFIGAGEDEEASPEALSADDEGTQAGVVIGTVNYMAPEQIRGQVDHRADIYSLGCTLFYLMTGRAVFEYENVAQTLAAHTAFDAPSLRDLRPDAPPWLDEVFQRLVAKSPDDRPQSMDDVVRLLREGASDAPEGRTAFVQRKAPPRQIVGMDLGCSRGVVAHCEFDEHAPPTWETLVCGDGLPAAVAMDGMSLKLGESAWREASGQLVACNIRRHLGQRLYPEPLGDSSFPPEVLLGLLLQRMDALRGNVGPPASLALTTPSCFGQGLRQAMLDAARIAGLPDPTLVNEPLAALYAEGWRMGCYADSQGTEKWLVYDLGGGKLDVIAAEVGPQAIDVIAASGNAHLGGSDWDAALLNHVCEQCVNRFDVDPREHPPTAARLQRTCERAKIRLMTESYAPVDFKVDGRLFRLNVTRENFDRLGDLLLQRAEFVLDDCLAASGWSLRDIDRLLLVGRATRMPGIRNLMMRKVGRSTIIQEASSAAVARGAALLAWRRQAAQRGMESGPELRLRSAFGVGVSASVARTGLRRDAILIPRGSRLPHRYQRSFRTREDNQATVSLRIIESQDRNAEHCELVGYCEADLPRGLPAGSPIEVEFLLQEDERLMITIEASKTGYRTTKDIAHRGRLSPIEITRWREWVEHCRTLQLVGRRLCGAP